ncbi:unnamed protein product [Staurois parvus]|uniref:Uncharacterized protein n=1 Tax=Staurois parvus TaxID=386267 RepID=A0ABN9D4A5_9NEOB|nr:unnamed protein product [Staurois parvus]
MQTASTIICERMGHSQELSEIKCGTVIGCHLLQSPSVKFPCYKIFHSQLLVVL